MGNPNLHRMRRTHIPEEVYDLSQGWNNLAAELLYATMPGGPPAEELAFYERRIRANEEATLDQACGTGRHLFPLLARGLEVHGADISADALHFARKEAETQKVHPTLYHQRMEECNIPHKYGTIYIANGTFQIITERHQVLSTLQRFIPKSGRTPNGRSMPREPVPAGRLGKSRTSAIGPPVHSGTWRTVMEPIGPGAIIVHDKAVSIVMFSGAWPDCCRGACTRYLVATHVAHATDPPSAERAV